MNDCAIIVLGASGDLSKRKIMPALYHLFAQNKLGNSVIIGAALDDITAQQLLERAKPFIKKIDQSVWQQFAQRVSYRPIDFHHESDFSALAKELEKIEKKAGLAGNRIVYCATAPYFYCMITQYVATSGLIQKGKQQKIVYEKPFGHDLQSAHEINQCIARHFDESQIFRIDHYLTKELVGNIALVRFTNIVFEPLWNNRYIDQVQIVFDEELCLDGRGAFYDKYGALADVVQNHMMQLVALIGMEAPERLTGDFIRAERAKVLQKVKVIDAVLGQYQGYTKEKDVGSHSKTETFAQVYLRIDNPRWSGVPFYLKTGKCLDKKETAIYIKFKKVDCLLTNACPSEPNYLMIAISPTPLFALMLNEKKPGKSDEVMPVQMRFAHQATQENPEAYETLFEEIIKGEQSVSVRFDEIEYAWKIVDAIRALKPDLFIYEKRSTGPKEAEQKFDKKHGMRWTNLPKM